MNNKEKLNCRHEKMQLPNFDPVEAKTMQSYREIRLRFPRYQGDCPDCEKFLTVYASIEHRKAGNW